MVKLQLTGEPEVDAAALAGLPQWSELLRQLLRGMYHGLNGGLSSAEATLHLAIGDREVGPKAAEEMRESLKLLERLVRALEPLTSRAARVIPEPIALDQVAASLRPTLDLQLATLGTDFVADAASLRPVRAPWSEVRDALLLLLSRSAREAREAGVRRVDLDGEVEGDQQILRASYRGPEGERVETGALRVPLA